MTKEKKLENKKLILRIFQKFLNSDKFLIKCFILKECLNINRKKNGTYPCEIKS